MKTGRPRLLNDEQAAEAVRRHKLWRENMPRKICADLGISPKTLHAYLVGRHKVYNRA